MSCHRIKGGFICCPNIYKYKDFIFEWHYFCGPMKLRKNFEPAKLQGRKFFKVAQEWNDTLTKKQKEKTRVYG
jgi:hypothetical protein